MTTSTESIERVLRIAARPETVFRRFVEPEALTEWMGEVATLDPRPGGQWRLEYGNGAIAAGEFTVVEPPTRVAWTWGWEENSLVPPGSTTVEVELTTDGDMTVLTLRHTGLPDTEAAKNHGEGWDHFLPQLDALFT